MKRLLLCLSLVLLLVACKSSDRTLALPGKTLTVGDLEQLRPVGALPMAFDRRGELMAVLHFGEEAEVEIRSGDEFETLQSRKTVDGFPFMLRSDSAALYCASQQGILELNLTSNTTKLLKEGDYLPKVRNAGQTITVLEDAQGRFLTINSPGDILLSTAAPRFDQFGNGWAKSNNGWSMISPLKPATNQASRPGYLVSDQSSLRGAMQLVTKKNTVTRKGAQAYVSTIWIDHVQAMGERRSALVFAGADVLYFGFVPNRDLVWVVTMNCSYLVPLNHKPEAAANQSKLQGRSFPAER